MKNITFIVAQKNGAIVNARLSAMHHSAETRVGLVEAMFACIVVVALVGFALVVVR